MAILRSVKRQWRQGRVSATSHLKCFNGLLGYSCLAATFSALAASTFNTFFDMRLQLSLCDLIG